MGWLDINESSTIKKAGLQDMVSVVLYMHIYKICAYIVWSELIILSIIIGLLLVSHLQPRKLVPGVVCVVINAYIFIDVHIYSRLNSNQLFTPKKDGSLYRVCCERCMYMLECIYG